MRNGFLLFALTLAGCGSNDPCAGQSGACIGLRVIGNATGLDQLAVTVDRPAAETQTTSATPLTLPVKLPLLMPAGVSGAVHVGVDGLAHGTLVAHTDGVANLPAGGHVILTVTLNSSSGAAGDMAGDDMACPPGMQDNGHSGVCMPDCSSANLMCAAHEVCSDASGTASCVCAPGYVNMAGACTWGTVPADPSFEDTPAGSWLLSGGVTLNPTLAVGGLVDTGAAVWDKNAMCLTGGVARQTISMPPYAAAQPLALTVSAQETCSNSMFCGGNSALDIKINGASNFFPTSGAFTNGSVCLGDRSYGGTFDLILKPWDKTVCGGSMISAGLQVDHLSIDVNPSCPTPGTVLNGNFDGAGGWTAVVSNGGAAGIAAVGTAGSNGGQIKTTAASQGAALRGSMSPSVAQPNDLALQFDVKGPGSRTLLIYGPHGNGSFQQDRPYLYGTVDGNFDAAFHTAKICVPDWARGVVMPILFQADMVSAIEWDIDNVSLVTDGSCAAGGVSEPSFERTDLGKVWQLASDTSHSAYATIDTSSIDARTGNGSLRLQFSNFCGSASATSTLTVPPPSGAAGPALKFWYKLPLATNTSFASVPGGPLPVTPNYKAQTICLDPSVVGEPVVLIFSGYSGGTCANPYPVETLSVDDVSVTTDATCPAM